MTWTGFIKTIGAIRFFLTKGSANYVQLDGPSSEPASNITLRLPNTLPPSSQALIVSNTGDMSYQAILAGVTSVALSAPSIFSVSGSPVTSTGTLGFSLNTQAANLILASPNGSTGAPTFRGLVADDIPSLTATKISNFDTQVRTSRLDQMAVPTAVLNLNNQRINNVADPTSSQDAATKAYVDAAVQGLDIKDSVKVALFSNVNLASPGATLDGVTMAAGDRFLAAGQTTGSQNGIYIWNGAAVAATRAPDADSSADMSPGTFVFVEQGTAADNGYVMTNNSFTLGTTAATFVQFSGAGQIDAGAGLTKTGNQLNVGGGTGITVNADSVQISASYTGQSSITTLGTITTGVWNGTDIAVANGGTGASTASQARSNLGAPGIFRQTFTDANLVGGLLTITHNLGNQRVMVQIFDEGQKWILPDDITLATANTCQIDLSSYGTLSGTYYAVVVG